MVRFLLVYKAKRLEHINLIVKCTMEEGVLNVKMFNGPINHSRELYEELL